MRKIQDLLKDFSIEYNIEGKASDVEALEAFLHLCSMDSTIKTISHCSVHKGTLSISVPHSLEAFHIMMKKSFFIDEVNRICGKDTLKSLQVNNKDS